MPEVSGQNEKFLQKEFVVPKVFEIMNPYLAFLPMVEKVKADSRAVQYKKEEYSDSTDPKKEKPRKRTAGSDWTYVDISQMSIDSALLQKTGFAVRIDEDAIDSVQGVDEIKRAFRKTGFWLAEDFNTKMGAQITNDATTPSWTPEYEWSADEATPVEDLRKLKYEMKREGYPYRLTDTFVNMDNMEELEGYLVGLDVPDGKQNAAYGKPVINPDDTIDIPVSGRVHGLQSGIDEGDILAMDRNNPGATLFYNNSSRYATKTIRYRGSDGKWKEIDNFGFNFHKYTDPESHDVIMQFWMDTVTVVKEPYSILHKSGI